MVTLDLDVMILSLEIRLTCTNATGNCASENIVETQIKTFSGGAIADCSLATAPIFIMTENFPSDALCNWKTRALHLYPNYSISLEEFAREEFR